ncbi:MAG: helix-turn-helix domain-containing protein [Candidatus Solibacter sp.]|jgi:hypothetical protein
MQSSLLDEKEAASLLKCSVAFLRRCRLFRTGPPFAKIGRLVRYRAQDLVSYIEASMEGRTA